MADPSKLGMEFPVYSIRVEKNKIAEFVAALEQKDDTEQINPLYRDVDAAKKAGFENIPTPPTFSTCLLYTSDAADELPCVDLGGRRIIKKKKYYTVQPRRDYAQHEPSKRVGKPTLAVMCHKCTESV